MYNVGKTRVRGPQPSSSAQTSIPSYLSQASEEELENALFKLETVSAASDSKVHFNPDIYELKAGHVPAYGLSINPDLPLEDEPNPEENIPLQVNLSDESSLNANDVT